MSFPDPDSQPLLADFDRILRSRGMPSQMVIEAGAGDSTTFVLTGISSEVHRFYRVEALAQ